MGGIGSGRKRSYKSYLTADRCDQVSIFGVSVPADATHINIKGEEFGIVWTACNYGKHRPWLVCPRCSRRVGKLYHPFAVDYRQLLGELPRCRQCWNLDYESSHNRVSRKAQIKFAREFFKAVNSLSSERLEVSQDKE